MFTFKQSTNNINDSTLKNEILKQIQQIEDTKALELIEKELSKYKNSKSPTNPLFHARLLNIKADIQKKSEKELDLFKALEACCEAKRVINKISKEQPSTLEFSDIPCQIANIKQQCLSTILDIIDKLITQCPVDKRDTKIDEILNNQDKDSTILNDIIKVLINKKEYTKALSFAKKHLSDFKSDSELEAGAELDTYLFMSLLSLATGEYQEAGSSIMEYINAKAILERKRRRRRRG